MTDTAQKAAEKDGAKKKAGPVKFVSKCHNQVLVRVPNRTQIVDGIVMPVAGKRIAFQNFEFVTSDPQEISFIRNHALFGSAVAEAEE